MGLNQFTATTWRTMSQRDRDMWHNFHLVNIQHNTTDDYAFMRLCPYQQPQVSASADNQWSSFFTPPVNPPAPSMVPNYAGQFPEQTVNFNYFGPSPMSSYLSTYAFTPGFPVRQAYKPRRTYYTGTVKRRRNLPKA